MAERRPGHAPELRGPRLRRRGPRRADRQHRRRPPDRLGRRVQQLHRAVRPVRHRHGQPPGAAGAVRVPLRPLAAQRRRRPDARGQDTNLDLGAAQRRADGEIGLVTQQDHGLWQDQTGAPADPQAGNIPGGKRDVLRSATFNDGKIAAVAVDSGAVRPHGRGAQRVGRVHSARMPQRCSTSTRRCPSTTRCSAQVRVSKPTAGWKANAYLIFDYHSPTDFKFAGLDQSRATRSSWAVAPRPAGSSTCRPPWATSRPTTTTTSR